MYLDFHLLATMEGTEQFKTFSCWLCEKITAILSVLPSTPEAYTVGGLISAAGAGMPYIGTGIIYELYSMIRDILMMVFVWKTLKMLAFLKFI